MNDGANVRCFLFLANILPVLGKKNIQKLQFYLNKQNIYNPV
jgi:hypothetical protein